jgi:C-terminal processing protease CtpA/Prc
MPDSTTGGYLVKSLAADGAAARSGQISVGDVVTHVDGCALRQLSLPQVRDLIRGPPEKYVCAVARWFFVTSCTGTSSCAS